MMYILDQRLRAQNIPDEKAKKGKGHMKLLNAANRHVWCTDINTMQFQCKHYFYSFAGQIQNSLRHCYRKLKFECHLNAIIAIDN